MRILDRSEDIVDLRIILEVYAKTRSTKLVDFCKLSRLLHDLKEERLTLIQLPKKPLLNVAACQNHTKIIDTVLSTLDEGEKTQLLIKSHKWSPLHAAAVRGCSKSVRTILKHCSPELQEKLLSAKCDKGRTAQQYAGIRGHKDTEDILRTYGKPDLESKRSECVEYVVLPFQLTPGHTE